MTGLYKFPEYEQHPIAIALMPGGMDEPEFEAFCADVEARGVIMPVTLYEGKVLDGWHRYRAAKRTGCAFKEIQYEGKDPAGYIASVNVLRRKLSSLQRALVGAKLHREHGLTQREACKKLGISNEVVTLVLKAMDSKNAMLIKRIESSADFTRGMLKEELEDAGLMRSKSDKVEAPAGAASDLVNLFNPKNKKTDAELDDILGSGDTGGIGDDDPLPDTGKKNTHPERKSKKTAAQLLQEGFKALMFDEKQSFLQMIFPEAKPILQELGLLDGEAEVHWPFGKDKKPAAKKTAVKKEDKAPAKKPAAKKTTKQKETHRAQRSVA
jgi:ParB-like chromosome segregation protein Spo0J